MPFKIKPFQHPEYSALRERSEFLANLWGIGHLLCVLFLSLAFATPLIIGIFVMIDPEDTKERGWDAAESSAIGCLMIAAIGFALKRYARNKGKT